MIYSSSQRLCDFWDNREQQEGDRGAAEGRDGRRRGGVRHPRRQQRPEGRKKSFSHLKRWPEYVANNQNQLVIKFNHKCFVFDH